MPQSFPAHPTTSDLPSFAGLSPGTATNLTFPFVDNGSGTLWSGNLGVCSAATCSSAIASVCDAGSCSAIGPGTIAEWTFAKVGTDYYE